MNFTLAMPLFSTPNKAKRFFDRLSHFYDVINPVVYPSSMREELISQIEGSRILDFGVGTGYTTKQFPQAVGIDLSMRMLERAKDYRGQLIRTDFLRAPFKSECFDTIISAGSFYYLPDPVEGLQTFNYLLKSGGVILLLCPNTTLRLFKPFVHIYSHQSFKDLFSKTGFTPEIIKTSSSRGYICFCKARKNSEVKDHLTAENAEIAESDS